MLRLGFNSRYAEPIGQNTSNAMIGIHLPLRRTDFLGFIVELHESVLGFAVGIGPACVDVRVAKGSAEAVHLEEVDDVEPMFQR
mmetsp:Transcript_21806/g.44811  ORF Transcript_21806/g.44811 Transcript_21806/m.44811 type:complete len:84 (+) Transcript_21806:77-328(+)